MGAKNHGVIMPDANKEYTINQLVGAAFGAAGQRCMALTTAVMVGESQDWIKEVAEKAVKLNISAGHEAGADLGRYKQRVIFNFKSEWGCIYQLEIVGQEQ